jgi:hypothetical protein
MAQNFINGIYSSSTKYYNSITPDQNFTDGYDFFKVIFPESPRIAIQSKYMYEYTYAEIANNFQVDKETAENWVRQGLDLLRTDEWAIVFKTGIPGIQKFVMNPVNVARLKRLNQQTQYNYCEILRGKAIADDYKSSFRNTWLPDRKLSSMSKQELESVTLDYYQQIRSLGLSTPFDSITASQPSQSVKSQKTSKQTTSSSRKQQKIAELRNAYSDVSNKINAEFPNGIPEEVLKQGMADMAHRSHRLNYSDGRNAQN